MFTNLWYEKYRPATVDDLILPDYVISQIKSYIEAGALPHLGLFSRRPGTGKTSLAKVIINELNADSLWINASLDKGIDVLRTKIHRFSTSPAFGDVSTKIVVMDEFDNFTHDGQAAFRGFIDEFSSNVTFIFTGNIIERVIAPLLDRLQIYDFQNFNPRDIVPKIFKRLQFILNTEQITYTPADIKRIVSLNYPGIRKMVGDLAKYTTVVDGVKQIVVKDNADTYNNILQVISSKQYKDILKLAYSDMNSAVYTDLANDIDKLVKPDNLAEAYIVLNKYQYQSNFVQDTNLNFAACMAELCRLV